MLDKTEMVRRCQRPMWNSFRFELSTKMESLVKNGTMLLHATVSRYKKLIEQRRTYSMHEMVH